MKFVKPAGPLALRNRPLTFAKDFLAVLSRCVAFADFGVVELAVSVTPRVDAFSVAMQLRSSPGTSRVRLPLEAAAAAGCSSLRLRTSLIVSP